MGTKVLRRQVADRVHSAAIHLLRRLRKSDGKLGISAPRLSALSVLVFAGDRTLGQLAQAEQVTAPTMSKLVQALEADGLVVRKSVASDGRAVLLSATKKGQRALRGGRHLRVATLTKLMVRLRPAELDVLAQAAKLLENLSQQTEEN